MSQILSGVGQALSGGKAGGAGGAAGGILQLVEKAAGALTGGAL